MLHGKAYKNRRLAWRSMLSKRFTIIRPLTAQIIACPVFTRYLYNIQGHCFSILILYLWQSFSILKGVHSKTWHQLTHGLMLKGSLLVFTKLRLLWLINKLCFIKVIITFSESWIMNYTPAKQLSKFIDMIPGVGRIGKSEHQLS